MLDLIMPGLDGFSICQRVKACSDEMRTKIIAMPGFTQEGNLRKARESGTDLCLEKPFQLTTLKEMVITLLGEARNIPSAALGLERRRSLRVPAEFPVICTPITGAATSPMEPRAGKTLNANREGVLLALDVSVELFTLLTMQVVLRKGQIPLQLVGESRWKREKRDHHLYQVGLAFVGLPPQVSKQWAGEIYAAR